MRRTATDVPFSSRLCNASRGFTVRLRSSLARAGPYGEANLPGPLGAARTDAAKATRAKMVNFILR